MRTLSSNRRHLAAAVLVVACLSGCSQTPSGNGKVNVTDINVGRALAQDDTIAEDARTASFWTTDTFYVSVQAEPVAAATAAPGGAAPSATLKARWTGPDGAVAAESDEKTISPTGPMAVAFQASKQPERWTPGDYKVEILVDGVSVGSRDLNAR